MNGNDNTNNIHDVEQHFEKFYQQITESAISDDGKIAFDLKFFILKSYFSK